MLIAFFVSVSKKDTMSMCLNRQISGEKGGPVRTECDSNENEEM